VGASVGTDADASLTRSALAVRCGGLSSASRTPPR